MSPNDQAWLDGESSLDTVTSSQVADEPGQNLVSDRFAGATEGALESFGTRLRRLRIEAGLTQSELGKGLVSASYLSHLEADSRMASPKVINALARRLGVAAAILRDGEDRRTAEAFRLALAYAELALLNGEPLVALQEFRRVAADPMVARVDRISARLGIARSYEYAGELEEAIVELRSLIQLSRVEPEAVPLLTTATALARCYQLSGDTRRAMHVAEESLVRAQELGLEGTVDYLRLASTVMMSHFNRGDVTHASVLARELIESLDNSGDERAMASIYWNASIVEDDRGNLRDALHLAERALAHFNDSHDVISSARLRVTYAWLLLRQDPPEVDLALTTLKQAGSTLAALGSRSDQASCATELARAELLSGHPERAVATAESALSMLSDVQGTEHVWANLVRGRALDLCGREAEALEAYDIALAVSRRTSAHRQAAAVLREVGEMHLAHGRPEAAAQMLSEALDAVAVRPTIPGIEALRSAELRSAVRSGSAQY